MLQTGRRGRIHPVKAWLAIWLLAVMWCCPSAAAEPVAADSFDPKKFEEYQAEAYKWYLLAAAQGDEKAKDNASALQPLLLESQLTEAKQRAEQFKLKGGAQP